MARVGISIAGWMLPESHALIAERWRGAPNQELPFFSTRRLHGVCLELRQEVQAHLRASLADLRRSEEGARVASANAGPVLRAAEATRYGAIYWMTKHEAQAARLDGTARDARLLDEYGAWFEEGGRLHVLWAGAVARFLRDSERRHVITDRFVPVEGFQPLGQGAVCVREADRDLLMESAGLASACLDLHDFAHQAAASLCPELYGNRFHTVAFRQLPAQLTDLVAGFESLRTPQHADGTLFGVFLSHLFSSLVDLREPERLIVDRLAAAILPYLLGEGPLYDATRERFIYPSRSINIYELAVLAQNKAYELPASELEQLMFTRGGLDGKDDLEGLTTSERVGAISSLSGRTFHEARNTLKHRAHALAYQYTVEEIWRRETLIQPERQLAARIFRHLRFEDHRCGIRRDLFRDAATELRDRRNHIGDYPELFEGQAG